jgi:L-ribulose-5-phosphate 3-epimerase
MDRRKFISSAAVAATFPAINSYTKDIKMKEDMKAKPEITIGVITSIKNPEEDVKKVREFGFDYFQAGVAEYTPEMAKRIANACEKFKVSPLTLVCMGPGPYIWNLSEGPSTIGLIPHENRDARIQHLKDGIDFCHGSGFSGVLAHFGFIPENPKDVLYLEFIPIMKEIADYALKRGKDIYFETGQETPVTLLRAIQDIGAPNIYVNLDVGNLLLYGKANPLDGLQVLSKYVRSLHAKDADYPVNPLELGKEYPIPEGKVNFPGIVSKLKKIGFKGCIVIENELSSNSKEYLARTKKYLEGLIETS